MLVPDWAVEQVFDLFDNLGATDEQLDFPIVYASALQGFATLDWHQASDNMHPLLDTVLKYVPAPVVDPEGPFQMQISSLDYSSYVGTIGIGRINRGKVQSNMPVMIINREGETRPGRILQIMHFAGLERQQIEEASAGDIIAITGIDNLAISDTVCDKSVVELLPVLDVDEPTISMTFQVNDSPFAGREGKYITSRKLRERLETELLHNVALKVEDTSDPDKFFVSGRGELHLAILLENMRREGYELAISRPRVIYKMVGEEKQEPYEVLTVDVQDNHQGTIMEKLGSRSGQLQNMLPDSKGRVRLDYIIPTRGLIGFHTEFMMATSGTGLLHHVFHHYGPVVTTKIAARSSGALISNALGSATGYSLWNLQDRGRMFIKPQVEVYEGMIVGEHIRDNDLVVNVIRPKQLTNVRASGTDEAIILTPPIQVTLEWAMEFINDDELVEITPLSIRLRKKLLKEHERKRESRTA